MTVMMCLHVPLGKAPARVLGVAQHPFSWKLHGQYNHGGSTPIGAVHPWGFKLDGYCQIPKTPAGALSVMSPCGNHVCQMELPTQTGLCVCLVCEGNSGLSAARAYICGTHTHPNTLTHTHRHQHQLHHSRHHTYTHTHTPTPIAPHTHSTATPPTPPPTLTSLCRALLTCSSRCT